MAKRVNDTQLMELWPTRLPDKEIAARMGHSLGTVRRRAMQIGLKPRRVVWSEDPVAQEMEAGS